MMMIRNNYSLGRVYQLLRIDALWMWKKLFLGSLIALVAIMAFVYLMHVQSGSTHLVVLTGIYTFEIFTYVLLYYAMLSSKLWGNEGTSYCSIPSTAGERLTHLLVLGVVYYGIALFVLQATLLFEFSISPGALEAVGGYRKLLIGGTSLINPFVFLGMDSPAVLMLTLAFFGTVRFKNFIYPILIVIAGLVLVTKVAQLWSDPEVMMQVRTILLYGLSAVAIVASYFALKKIQQKQ